MCRGSACPCRCVAAPVPFQLPALASAAQSAQSAAWACLEEGVPVDVRQQVLNGEVVPHPRAQQRRLGRRVLGRRPVHLGGAAGGGWVGSAASHAPWPAVAAATRRALCYLAPPPSPGLP